MTVRRLLMLAGTAAAALALSQGAALAHGRYHHHVYYHPVYYHPVYYRHVYYHHAHYYGHARYYHHRYAAWDAGYYGRESAYVEDPYGGPSLMTSRPVPDTPSNRMRYGGPMSRGGWMTAPAGD